MRTSPRSARPLASLVFALLLAPVAFGAASCDTYHYYDITVTFDPAFTDSLAGNIGLCDLVVSGADSHTSFLPNGQGSDHKTVCPIAENHPVLGTFEYATFADSGKLEFTLNAYNGQSASAACLYGTGAVTLPATSQLTTTGAITLTQSSPGCPNNQ